MSAKIYDTTQQAFVDAETPKVYDGSAYVDANGKVQDGGIWEDAWNTFRWITTVQTAQNDSTPSTVTFNSDGTIALTGTYINAGGNVHINVGIAIDNYKYGFKGMVVRVISNTSTDDSRAEVFVNGYDAINNLSAARKGYLLFGKQWNTLNTDITVDFVNGTVSGTRYNTQYLAPLTQRYLVIFPAWNGSPTVGAYANATIKILSFY